MSVVAVNLIGQNWSDDKDGSRTYTRTYNVHTDSASETMVAVRAALPLNWTADGVDAAAVVVTRSAEQDEQVRTLWHGEVQWKWAPEDEDEEDPLDRAPKIRWTSQLFTKPVLKDSNGDAVVNSAGDYFDPPPEAEFVRWNVNIQFNATSIPSNIRSYAGAINSGSITIDGETIAAERARVVALDIGELQTENDVQFRSITLGIEVRDDEDDQFDLEVLDQGFRIKDGTDLVDILIEDEDGNKQRPSAPVLLDGSGGKLSDPSPSNAEFLTFEFPRRLDLTVFPGIS